MKIDHARDNPAADIPYGHRANMSLYLDADHRRMLLGIMVERTKLRTKRAVVEYLIRAETDKIEQARAAERARSLMTGNGRVIL